MFMIATCIRVARICVKYTLPYVRQLNITHSHAICELSSAPDATMHTSITGPANLLTMKQSLHFCGSTRASFFIFRFQILTMQEPRVQWKLANWNFYKLTNLAWPSSLELYLLKSPLACRFHQFEPRVLESGGWPEERCRLHGPRLRCL